MFDVTVNGGVLQLRRARTRWLSTGWSGGFQQADAAYNLTVPDGWDRSDVGHYVEGRREAAGFDEPGPALLTGVDLAHARGARSGPVAVVATVGLSNPAGLPMAPSGGPPAADIADGAGPGTVNLLVGTTRALDDGALATLLAVAVEARTATLRAETGFPGTTTDATVAGCDPAGEAAPFAGSATPVGAAARACVREAVTASLRSRYAERELPESVQDAAYGVRTDRTAEVFTPSAADRDG